MSKFFRLFFFTAGFFLNLTVYAQSPPVDPKSILPDGPVDFTRTAVLFYDENCRHCHEEIAFIKEIQPDYPNLVFVQIEVDESNNQNNIRFYKEVMDFLGSTTVGVPRLVVNGRVFVGFTRDPGEPLWLESLHGWMGYANQIQSAIKELSLNRLPDNHEVSPKSMPSLGSERKPLSPVFIAIIISTVIAAAYFFIIVILHKRKKINKSLFSVMIGIGGFLIIAEIFFVLSLIPEGLVIDALKDNSFFLMVVIIALLDGFNPCAFTVLFILLSLLTYTKKRSLMLSVSGVFILSSGVIYMIFILLIVLLGSFSIDFFDYWILRIVGGVVFLMGLVSILEIFRKRGNVTSLSSNQKNYFAKSARNIIRRLNNADSPMTKVLTLGSVVVLAIVVNGLELGCTAVLPAVYMSSLLLTYGNELTLAHFTWTLLYGIIYIIPMLVIVLNFIVNFRSSRVDEKYGKSVKLTGSVIMILIGLTLVINPTFLII